MNKVLLLGLIALVSAALIGGFMAVGGPGYARLEQQDAQRARHLQDLYVYLQCRSSGEPLPETLADESYCPREVSRTQVKDPVTGEAYQYRRLDDRRFEICAVFVTESQMGGNGFPYRALVFDGKVGCRSGTNG